MPLESFECLCLLFIRIFFIEFFKEDLISDSNLIELSSSKRYILNDIEKKLFENICNKIFR